jgi:hypothetical protein
MAQKFAQIERHHNKTPALLSILLRITSHHILVYGIEPGKVEMMVFTVDRHLGGRQGYSSHLSTEARTAYL